MNDTILETSGNIEFIEHAMPTGEKRYIVITRRENQTSIYQRGANHKEMRKVFIRSCIQRNASDNCGDE